MVLTGRRALVTGASRGLGASIARRLAADGASVAIHYHRDAAGAQETARDLPAPTLTLQADLADPEQAAALLQQIETAWGGLDLLVNNAGIAPVRPWTEITPEGWQESIGINLNGPFYTLRAALPLLMKAPGGAAVVNISSVVAFNGGSFGPAYTAAKAGLIGLTRSAAKDLGPQGIRVNCIAPGPLDSPLAHALPVETLNAMIAQTPLRRLGTFDDVAELVAWLLSPASGYITGQTILIDGGRIMH